MPSFFILSGTLLLVLLALGLVLLTRNKESK
jgi:hypothetical protein